MAPGFDGSEQWHADAIVEGTVVAPTDGSEPMFSGLRLELDSLPMWARAHGPSELRQFGGDRKIQVEVKTHELVSGDLANGARMLVTQSVSTKRELLTYEIRQPVVLAIEGVEPSTWSGLLNQWLQPVQVLLWLATARPVRVERIDVPTDDIDAVGWQRLHAPLLERPATPGRALWPHDYLFFATELRGGFGAGMNRWFSVWWFASDFDAEDRPGNDPSLGGSRRI